MKLSAPSCQDVSLAGRRAPRIVSLFSGYGGLEMGIQSVVGGDVIAHVEFDDAPSRILAHRYPGVPNLGDITTVDWAGFLKEHPELGDLLGTYRPGLILCGGFPCQDVSLAGLRRGLKSGTRSGLWSEFARAIDVLRPELVVIENVRGLLSAEADRGLESDPTDLGDGKRGPVLRALGAVLGDLAELGYDARWLGLRAADAGAPHGRFRVFILAWPADTKNDRRQIGGTRRRSARFDPASSDLDVAADAGSEALRFWTGLRASEPVGLRRGRSDDDRFPAPAADAAGRGRDRRAQDEVGEAVERVAPAGSGGGPHTAPDARGARLGEHPGGAPAEEAGTHGGDLAAGDRGPRPDQNWGPYRPAIERWERRLGRRAPNPTRPDGKNGANRLNPAFVEWMMGLPEGWVTAPEIGLTRAEQLKALGNGVVRQQAALATELLLEAEAVAA